MVGLPSKGNLSPNKVRKVSVYGGGSLGDLGT